MKPVAPKSQTMGLLIALAILMAAGFLVLYFKIDLDSQTSSNDVAMLSQQVQQLDMRVNKMNAPVSAMPEPAMATASSSRIIAYPPDLEFVIRGVGVCDDAIGISAPQKLEDSGRSYTAYDLSYIFGPEDSDLGSVAIQLEDDPSVYPDTAFSLDGRKATYVLTSGGKLPDCTLSIAWR